MLEAIKESKSSALSGKVKTTDFHAGLRQEKEFKNVTVSEENFFLNITSSKLYLGCYHSDTVGQPGSKWVSKLGLFTLLPIIVILSTGIRTYNYYDKYYVP